SRSRPKVVTCGDRGYPVTRHDHGRVASPALPDLRPAHQLADPVRPHNLVQGHRVACAAPRGRRAAENEPEAAPGLGRPSIVRCADPMPVPALAKSPPGHSGHRPTLAPPPGSPEVDLPEH